MSDSEYVKYRNRIIKAYANRNGQSKEKSCRKQGLSEKQLSALLMQTCMNVAKTAKTCMLKFNWTYDPDAPEFNRTVMSNFSNECIQMLEAEAGLNTSTGRSNGGSSSRFTMDKFNLLLKLIYMPRSTGNERILQRMVDGGRDITMEVEA